MILRDKLGVTVLLKNRCCLRFFKTVGLGLDHNRAQTFGGSFNALSALKDLPNWRSEFSVFNRKGMQMRVGEVAQVFFVVNDMLTEMLTVKQAAYRYNFSFRTIQKWIDEGKISPIEIEGRNWIKKTDIEQRIQIR
jgi:excisionase family DNA binding protein